MKTLLTIVIEFAAMGSTPLSDYSMYVAVSDVESLLVREARPPPNARTP
jgi:hypothetical protein